MKKAKKRKSNWMRESSPDGETDDYIIEVSRGLRSIRDIRNKIVKLAYELMRKPHKQGYLILYNPAISADRLSSEFEQAKQVIIPIISERLELVVFEGNKISFTSSDRICFEVKDIVRSIYEATPNEGFYIGKADYPSEILKVLIYHWILTNGESSKILNQDVLPFINDELVPLEPLTSKWLAETVGCTYRPVATTLDSIERALLRETNQSVTLGYFPRADWEKLSVFSKSYRSYVGYEDRSGNPRSIDSLIRRLKSIGRKDIAIGGVLGAERIYKDINIVGVPRLDLVVHCTGSFADLSFIRILDPALKRIKKGSQPPHLAVHFLRRSVPFFKQDKEGLLWADPVECLLDLQEARLDYQALDFRRAVFPESGVV